MQIVEHALRKHTVTGSISIGGQRSFVDLQSTQLKETAVHFCILIGIYKQLGS